MQNIYDTTAILEILNIFKVNKIVLSGIKDLNLINTILNYNASCIQIDTADKNSIKNSALNVLPNLKDYDTILIDDDPNWYTVFNELNLIKKTNEEFPLVLIYNNNFPNKRRDSYSNPDSIPQEFRHKYTSKLPICINNKKIYISDGYYHACDENTDKNGVSNAIEDFLQENSHIGMLKINLQKEICILYSKSQINQKRISIIPKKIQNYKINNIELSEKLIENQLLISYIDKNNLFNENLNKYEAEISKKNKIINEYENRIIIQNNEMNFKDTQISGFESDLSLKESKIKNFESKLVNKNKKISILENQLEKVNNNLNSLSSDIDKKNNKISTLKNQLKTTNNNYKTLTQEMDDNTTKINDLINNFEKLESYYSNQINQKEQKLKKNDDEHLKQINTLKNDFATQINITNENLKQKDNEIKTKKQELDNNKKRLNSIKRSFIKQSSNMVNKEYCITCFKEELSNNQLEIEYLKNNNLLKKILNPISYLYLILKSNPKELLLNIKLYRSIKNSKCFDIGFYLNNNKDLIESKWCKYFSPELHYICNGFNEKRTFNKKYFNRKSKKDLLNYILTCDK